MAELDMGFVRRFPGECCAEVSRKGDLQPCDKTAYVVTVDDDGHCWPVCIHHARGRRLVPLASLLNLASQEVTA